MLANEHSRSCHVLVVRAPANAVKFDLVGGPEYSNVLHKDHRVLVLERKGLWDAPMRRPVAAVVRIEKADGSYKKVRVSQSYCHFSWIPHNGIPGDIGVDVQEKTGSWRHNVYKAHPDMVAGHVRFE